MKSTKPDYVRLFEVTWLTKAGDMDNDGDANMVKR